MTYIPKLALELQSFSTIEEMNDHMNLHYYSFKNQLTKSQDSVFHLIKKYACVVAGVCWLKQESIAKFANVSVKTVERGLKFFKGIGVLKIYHTKRSNGLNGNCYYVLQPYQEVLSDDSEEIVSVEENVGAREGSQSYDTYELETGKRKDKLLKNSSQTLVSSLKTKNEEEIIHNARVLPTIKSINIIKEHVPTIEITLDVYEKLVTFLMAKQFTEKAAKQISSSIVKSFPNHSPRFIFRAYERAYFKLQKRLTFSEPIISLVDYYISLVKAELQQGDTFPTKSRVHKTISPSEDKDKIRALENFNNFKDWLNEKSTGIR